MKQIEKVAIVRFLTDLIKSDTVIDTREIELFEKICDNYNIDGENIAQIGDIGPERMDYAKIAGALKYIVDEVKNLTKLDKGE